MVKFWSASNPFSQREMFVRSTVTLSSRFRTCRSTATVDRHMRDRQPSTGIPVARKVDPAIGYLRVADRHPVRLHHDAAVDTPPIDHVPGLVMYSGPVTAFRAVPGGTPVEFRPGQQLVHTSGPSASLIRLWQLGTRAGRLDFDAVTSMRQPPAEWVMNCSGPTGWLEHVSTEPDVTAIARAVPTSGCRACRPLLRSRLCRTSSRHGPLRRRNTVRVRVVRAGSAGRDQGMVIPHGRCLRRCRHSDEQTDDQEGCCGADGRLGNA